MSQKQKLVIILSGFFLLISCKQKLENEQTQFRNISPTESGIYFKNSIQEDRLFNHLVWESVFNGSGVAIGDINNDGLPELYFTGNQVPDALYLNKGNFTFEDITEKAGLNDKGWSGGVSMGDINGDGYLDIYVSKLWSQPDVLNPTIRKNKLYINKGDLSFVEASASYGLDDEGNTTNAAFLDFDMDGDLDLYVLNAPSNNYAQKLEYIQNNAIPYTFSDKLYRNDGNKFTDVTKDAGVEDYGFGLGIVCADLDNDGWTDIYVANDFEIADRMFINQKDGTFRDESQRKLKHISYSSMGTDAADLTNDGFSEIAVLDMQAADHFRSKTNMPSMDIKQFWTNVARGQHYQYMTNVLQWNRGYGYFSDIGQLAGIASTDWSWSVLLADFDNDRFKDIFISNGINRDMRNNDYADKLTKKRDEPGFDLLAFAKQIPGQALSNYMFKNNEGTLEFTNVSADWGLGDKSFSFGSAYGDLDMDGDLDLVVCNNNDHPFIYENQNIDGNNFIGLKLRPKAMNTFAYGAKIELFSGKIILAQEISPTRGYQSSMDPCALFGLGDLASIDSIKVHFQLKTYKYNFKDSLVNRYYTIHLEAKDTISEPGKSNETIFSAKELALGIHFTHTENRFDDFRDGRLMPHMESRNGPPLAYGDVNNDGLIDFIVGGAHLQAAVLYIQDYNGIFSPHEIPSDPKKENMGVCFVDVDNDSDIDLYLSNGGSEFPYNDPVYQDELLLNDGQGNFTLAKEKLPAFNYNGSRVIPIDFDKDGDMDLVLGGRGFPGKYPFAGRSEILINSNGVFESGADQIAPEWKNIGMVTDIDTLDINQDGWNDFIAVGEWMAPTLFINKEGKFETDTSYFNSKALLGWWYCVQTTRSEGSDAYNIFLGNIGRNTKYHPDLSNPLHIYASDLNSDNKHDIVLAKNGQDMLLPVRGKECSTGQIPEVSKKFRDYDSYANASLEDIYGKDELNEALHLLVTNFSSGVLRQNGNKFDFKAFPNEAQISPVMGIVLMDINNDQRQDLILTGNHYDAEVETTKHDAGNGLVLIQNEDKDFEPLTISESGFYTPGNAKDMIAIPYKEKEIVIVANNGFIVQAFELNK